ncbi:cobalt/nickel transport system permease protein [Desulfatibacillum alkenivorans DSM 16219]|jgi:cobalt/nickel transport system permease protein|uniref:Cobalt/nickel transport system permease protein n=1 Tax=Desulfatibacillum alkenivorans DSM 16219 TaxID=1121393 RepID=A0A1M6IDT1_9BACT|nr:cobalt transporter CbiM [Desulfatibacillum alkenivorans]SHJ32618.1 cobalt/nickel transport system permease protein [Desulfatibacillum alkenivorans DSM 16219]
MHISEGVLSGPVLAAGAAVAVAGTAYGLKKLDFEKIPRAAVLSAGFFVASLVHVPIGVSSAHLILNGILGLLLGWTAFPAIAVALMLQAVLFQFGGITTLGVNTVVMAAPAVFCYLVFGKIVAKGGPMGMAGAFACGFFSVLLSGVLVALALFLTEENFFEAAAAVLGAHVVIMIAEGVFSVICIEFLRKVQPGMLPGAQ